MFLPVKRRDYNALRSAAQLLIVFSGCARLAAVRRDAKASRLDHARRDGQRELGGRVHLTSSPVDWYTARAGGVADRCALQSRATPVRPGPFAIHKNGRMALQRMDNVGIVVESLDAAISFFAELGLELEGRAMIEGDWSGRVTGLRDQRVETAMMRMPDGHGRIELSRFLAPPVVADHRNAPVNALGYLRVMFAVDDLDDTLARLRGHGAQLVDEVVQYEDVYRLCYVRGPEGILIGLAERIG